MRHYSAILSLVCLSVGLVALSACGGGKSKSSSNGVSKISMSPTSQAVDQGGKLLVVATPQDVDGNTIAKATPTYSVQPNQNLISVSVNGYVCAGQWDSLTTPVICNPTSGTGEAKVIATVGNITGETTIVVLPPIDHISVIPATPDPATPADAAGLPCISQSSSSTAYAANTRTYTVAASFKGEPVTLSDAVKDTAVTWSINGSTIGTIAAKTSTDTSGNTVTDTRFAVVTALAPGTTQITASIGTHQATSADFVVCPVSKITIADTASPATPLPLASAGTLTLKATILDSRGVPVFLSNTTSSGTTTSLVSLTWINSQPLSASVSGTGVVTATATPGTTTVVASCSPPGCNLGLGAVYSNPFVVPVTGTSSGTTVYVGSKAQAADSTSTAPGKTLLPVTTADNKTGTPITLGDVPNSMRFNQSGTTLYIGTASGLIKLTTAGNTVAAPIAKAPGKVLAVSPNNAVITSDNSKVYVVDPTDNSVQTYNISGITAADFAPDSSKAYLVGGNQFAVYTATGFPVPESLPGATSVSFLTSGPFAYIADAVGLGVRATCNDLASLVPFDTGTAGPVPLSPAPTFARSLPDGLHLVTASSTNVNLVEATTNAEGFFAPATGCAPKVSNKIDSTAVISAGITPRQLVVSGDGKNAFVLSDSATLLGAKIDLSAGTVTPVSIPLQTSTTGTAQPAAIQQTTGGVTTDGTALFFGGSDNQIHRIDLTAATPTDTPIVLTSPPTGFTTDFVAVKP